jgi:peroxiredoxin Q/BCP
MMAVAGCANTPTVLQMEEAAAMRSPFIGLQAPDFTLPDQDDHPVSLSSLRGKWTVLYFYPKDDTPGCQCQATEFTALLAQFADMNAEVFGVSEDPPWSHQAFIKRYDLKLILLSDPDHAMMTAYGAWVQSSLGDQRFGRVIRSTFIIGPQGKIRYHWPEVIPKGHAARVRHKLAELQKAG